MSNILSYWKLPGRIGHGITAALKASAVSNVSANAFKVLKSFFFLLDVGLLPTAKSDPGNDGFLQNLSVPFH